jgi:hypothetical protein
VLAGTSGSRVNNLRSGLLVLILATKQLYFKGHLGNAGRTECFAQGFAHVKLEVSIDSNVRHR